MNYFELQQFSELGVSLPTGLTRNATADMVCIVKADLALIRLALEDTMGFGIQKTGADSARLLFSFGRSVSAHALASCECSVNDDLQAYFQQDRQYVVFIYELDGTLYFGFVKAFKVNDDTKKEIAAMFEDRYVSVRKILMSELIFDSLEADGYNGYDIDGDARDLMTAFLRDVAFAGTIVTMWFSPKESGVRVFCRQELPGFSPVISGANVYCETAIPFGFADGQGTVFVCAVDKQGIEQCALRGDRHRYDALYSLWD